MKRGHSLLTRHGRHVLVIVLWSTSFWFFFELLNLRFQNWYYVGVFRASTPLAVVLGGAFVVACFGTVFMGLFATAEVLAAFGAFRRWRGTPGRLPVWVSYAVQVLGLVMVGLALFFPRYLAPLIWGSLTFLVDPWNYRHGARSVLKDIEDGDFGVFARLFASGLICGLVWESFNFHAPQKWIYTVRGLEELKLFEMPLLGFLGFPALAFDALASYAFIAYWFHGNESWEHPADPSSRPRPRGRPPRWAVAAALVLQFPFWGGVNLAMMDVNIGSFELELEDVEALGPRALDRLRQEGIRRPQELLRLTRDSSRRSEVQLLLGLSTGELERLRQELELLSLKGIGACHGMLLKRSGVLRVEDLARREPDGLHRELRAQAEALGIPPPRLEMVRVWVLAARSCAPPAEARDEVSAATGLRQ
jgi:predicted flap endonuclease-1-like 5' DNA nuclease